MSNKQNVFICQPVKNINVLPAQKFGIPKYVYDGPQIDFNINTVISKIQESLSIAQKGDFLVLIGDPVLMALVSIEMYEMTEGKFNILKWDKRTKDYYVLSVDYQFDYGLEEQNNE